MFGIKAKERCRTEARLYAESIVRLLKKMTESMNEPGDQALAEIFGGIYLLYLCRESADFKHILPCLAEEFLGQTRHFHCAPADRPKRISYINACLSAYKTAEKLLLKQKKNPVEGLLGCTAAAGLMELLQSGSAYPALWKETVNLAISERKLDSYKDFAYPKAEEIPSTVPKPAANRITLMSSDKNPIEFQIIDTIPYQNETYVCLLNEKTGESVILRALPKPDGGLSYVTPGPVMADVIMELAKKRNPLPAMPGKKDALRTIALKNAKGQTVEFQMLDIIPHQGRTFVCLRGRDDKLMTILEAKDRPDGSASYEPTDASAAEAISRLFHQRNPNRIG